MARKEPNEQRPERAETDTSLRAERNKTDEHLAHRSSAIEKEADQVVELARERADSLVERAREKADAQAAISEGGRSPESVAVERRSQDVALSDERAEADDTLELERAEEKRVATLLLMLEREQTDERLVNERARSDDAVASRDDFLAIVSHDARGILGNMAMSAELLAEMTPEGANGQPMRVEVQRIRRLTGRMNRLVGDLIDVVSMESGKLRSVPVQQDAEPLLAEITETFGPSALARKITISTELSGGAFVASFDHDRIFQVLTNLIGNAIKFTAEGGSIKVGLAGTAGELRFTVTDTGSGIEPEHIETIFDRFAQEAKNDRRGLGLGLYIARCIVDAHSGKIWAESEAGKGASIHFTLPRAG